LKICECCKQEFIAKKTTSQTCSDACAKRFYKIKKRNESIRRVKIETAVKQKPDDYITEDQVKAIQAKEWLTLKEAAFLLNVSPLTLRRWVFAGKARSRKAGRKHLFDRKSLPALK